VLTVEPQRGAARCEHLGTRRHREQFRHGGCRPKDLLEVVQHEEQPPLAEVVL
jgi:hypothetical protein